MITPRVPAAGLTVLVVHAGVEMVAAMHAFDRATAELTGLARDREYDRQAQRVESLSVLDDRLARVKQVGRQVTDPSLRRGR